eukprot:682010-Pyramimonas_sp.AAC.1
MHVAPGKPRVLDKAWVDPGWRRTSTGPLPTFVPPAPRPDPPPNPKGIDACDSGARARWSSDSYKFH